MTVHRNEESHVPLNHDSDDMNEKRSSRMSANQSLSAISEVDGSEDEVSSSMAPDGGYGWVIVAASFFCFFVVDGTLLSFGEILIALEEHFHASKSSVGWVSSIMSGSYLLIGPVAAGLSNALGCRTVIMLGSLLSSCGLLLSRYAPNLSAMYAYACMTGIGYGFIFLPAACTIGFYFEKKRAFATGIAVCGSGIGGLLLGPITSRVLTSYGWETTIMGMAVMAFSCAFVSVLLKPLEMAAVEFVEDEPHDEFRGNYLTNGKPRANGSSPALNVNDQHIGSSEKFCSNLELDRDTQNRSRKNSELGSSKMSGSRKSIDHYRSKLSIDYGTARKRGLSMASLAAGERRLTQPDLKPMLRKDIFLSGSLQRIAEYRSQTRISEYHASVIHLPTLLGEDQKQVWGCIPFGFVEMLKSTLSADLMMSPSFVILAISGFLTMMGFYVPFMYLKNAAESSGVSKDKAALLLVVIGTTNTAGRIFCGWVSDLPDVNALAINNIFVIAGGIATACAPFVFDNFYLLCVYGAVFGFAIACFAALRSIIVVELFGLDKLTNGYGLLLLFQGVAAVFGTPTAGYFYEVKKNYDIPFYFVGVLIALSGVITIPIDAIMRWEKRRENVPNELAGEKIKVTIDRP